MSDPDQLPDGVERVHRCIGTDRLRRDKPIGASEPVTVVPGHPAVREAWMDEDGQAYVRPYEDLKVRRVLIVEME